jgi:hypothetical protein
MNPDNFFDKTNQDLSAGFLSCVYLCLSVAKKSYKIILSGHLDKIYMSAGKLPFILA